MFGIKGMKWGVKENFMNDKKIRKVFVSLPMRDRDLDDICNDMDVLFTKFVENANPEYTYELIDTTHKGLCPPDDNFLWYLGLSIQQLGEADFVIFDQNWRTANGCRVEHLICDLYKIPYVYAETEAPYADDEPDL